MIIVREMVGTSPKSWSDAARQAVATASKTVRNIRTIEVVKSTARIEDGEIVEYQVAAQDRVRVRGLTAPGGPDGPQIGRIRSAR